MTASNSRLELAKRSWHSTLSALPALRERNDDLKTCLYCCSPQCVRKGILSDHFQRIGDLIKAIRSLRRLGFSVSLPHQTADGIVFFEIDGLAFTVRQILELFDRKQLDRAGIRQFAAKDGPSSDR